MSWYISFNSSLDMLDSHLPKASNWGNTLTWPRITVMMSVAVGWGSALRFSGLGASTGSKVRRCWEICPPPCIAAYPTVWLRIRLSRRRVRGSRGFRKSGWSGGRAPTRIDQWRRHQLRYWPGIGWLYLSRYGTASSGGMLDPQR